MPGEVEVAYVEAGVLSDWVGCICGFLWLVLHWKQRQKLGRLACEMDCYMVIT